MQLFFLQNSAFKLLLQGKTSNFNILTGSNSVLGILIICFRDPFSAFDIYCTAMNKTNSRDVSLAQGENPFLFFFQLQMVAACDLAEYNRRNKKIK